MTEGEKAGSARVPVDPRAVDPEAAAREEAKRYGLPFEVALENVRASIAKRSAAVSRIRAIREEGAARIAAWRAAAGARKDGRDAGEDAGEAGAEPSPERSS